MTRARLGALALLTSIAALAPLPAAAQSITFLHTPPTSADEGEPIKITGNVFGASNMDRAKLYYRRPGGRWSTVELRTAEGDEYEAIIPSREVQPPGIEYYVVATDLVGNRLEIFASQAKPHRIPVGVEVPAEGESQPDEGEKPKKKPKAPPEEGAKPKPEEGQPAEGAKPEEGKEPKEAKEPKEKASQLEEELALYGQEDVVTLATRHAQTVSDAPAIASALTQEDMRATAARTVPDALKLMPGFETSRDVQGFWRIAVRGLRSDPEVLVLYDGHALNNPYDGRPLLAIPTESLERVEVVRGPGSALYGTGAFLGVANLVTSSKDELAGSASAGSFNTFEGDLSAGHTFGPFFAHADANVVYSQGYQQPITSDVYSADLERPLADGRRLKATTDPAGYTDDHHLFVNAGGEARLDLAGGKLALTGRFLREDRGALVGLFDAVGPNSRLQWNVALGDLRYERAIGAGSISARLFADVQQVDRLFQLTPAIPDFTVGGTKTGDTGGLQEQTRFNTRSLGAEVSGEVPLHPTNRLEIGISMVQLALTDFEFLTNYTVDSNGRVTFLKGLQPGQSGLQDNDAIKQRLQAGLFLQDQWRPVKPLSLTLGVRADLIQLPTVDGESASAKITGSHFQPSVNPRLGVVVNALPSLSFKALYGRAFRAPTMQELSDSSSTNDFSQGRPQGNPGLGPATVDTIELGVEELLTIAEGKIRLRADGFWNRFGDPILAVDKDGNDVPLLNRSPGIDVKGAEAEARFEASTRAGAFVNYSWFRATDLAAISPEFELLTDVPQYRVNLGLAIPLGGYLNLDLLTQLGAERRNNALSKLQALHHFRIPSYALMQAQLRTEPLFNHLELALVGSNVLQQSYQDDVPRPDRIPSEVPGPGFSAMLIARARW